jgi:hypothetical protein
MMQSLGSLIAELERAKSELRKFFEMENGMTEEQNGNAGNVERMGKGTKVLLSNRNDVAARPPTETKLL